MGQIQFTVDTKYGLFTDALYFTEAEFPSITQEIIDAQKQQRVDNWIFAIENPPQIIEE